MTDYFEIEYQYHLIPAFCLHTDLREYSKPEAQQIYCAVLQLYRIRDFPPGPTVTELLQRLNGNAPPTKTIGRKAPGTNGFVLACDAVPWKSSAQREAERLVSKRCDDKQKRRRRRRRERKKQKQRKQQQKKKTFFARKKKENRVVTTASFFCGCVTRCK